MLLALEFTNDGDAPRQKRIGGTQGIGESRPYSTPGTDAAAP